MFVQACRKAAGKCLTLNFWPSPLLLTWRLCRRRAIADDAYSAVRCAPEGRRRRWWSCKCSRSRAESAVDRSRKCAPAECPAGGGPNSHDCLTLITHTFIIVESIIGFFRLWIRLKSQYRITSWGIRVNSELLGHPPNVHELRDLVFGFSTARKLQHLGSYSQSPLTMARSKSSLFGPIPEFLNRRKLDWRAKIRYEISLED